jgi:hypothetical protein
VTSIDQEKLPDANGFFNFSCIPLMGSVEVIFRATK